MRMTARSVVLSVLLGAHPAWATAGDLLRLTADFGIKENALRVALTRMVSAGDLVRSADGYRLSERLLARQRRQDNALNPPTRRWDGSWVTAVVTAVGTDARSRGALRTALAENRFGELREGLWLRPDNLAESLPDEVGRRVRILHARDDAPAELAGMLWDLSGWSATARQLLREMSRASGIPARFPIVAAMVRHLLADPVLPAELLPGDWPADSLRSSYADFAALMVARRDSDRTNRTSTATTTKQMELR